jgi:hypothetical protein
MARENFFMGSSMRSRMTVLLFVVAAISLGSPRISACLVPRQRQTVASTPACRPADSAAVARAGRRFHEILATGDTAGINALLAPDLRVIEGGTVENRQEYLSHHFAADIEFAKAVKEERTSFWYRCEGSVAWLISTSNSMGKFRGRDIDSEGAELLLLSRNPGGWKIRVIQWSSAKRQPR